MAGSRKRSNGEGTLFWEERRGRWVAQLTLPDGERRKRTAMTKKEVPADYQITEHFRKQEEAVKDLDDETNKMSIVRDIPVPKAVQMVREKIEGVMEGGPDERPFVLRERGVARGVMHKNTASRKMSRLTKRVAAL